MVNICYISLVKIRVLGKMLVGAKTEACIVMSGVEITDMGFQQFKEIYRFAAIPSAFE